MKNILETMSFLVCSLVVLGSPALEASMKPTSVVASTNYKVDKYGRMFLASEGLTRLDENELKAAGLSNIENLDLGDNKLTSANLGVLSSMPNLKELSLRGNGITSLSGFPTLRTLETLDLGDNALTSEALNSFPNLPNLKELKLWGNKGISKDDIIKLASRFPKCNICSAPVIIYEIPDNSEFVNLGRRRVDLLNTESVPELKTAKGLYLEDVCLTSLAELRRLPLNNLEGLTVRNSGIKSLTEDDAELLKTWTQFKYLRIVSGQLRHVDVSCLSELPGLELLDLCENKDLRTLTGLASLACLKDLSVEYTKITPSDLYPQLSGLSKIENLWLDGTIVDVKMLKETLTRLKNLKKVGLRKCTTKEGAQISWDSITDLSAALTNVEIHSNYGVYKTDKPEP